MNENKQLMNLINETEFEKVVLKELVNKFSERFERYNKIIKTHPGYVESLDLHQLPVSERFFVLFCDILVDLEISFFKYKLQNYRDVLEHLDLLTKQLAILKNELKNMLSVVEAPCEQML